MSAGAFENSRYETDAGNVVPITIQPETATADIGGTVNAAPAGAILAGWPSASVSKGKRQNGINARTVTIKFSAPPAAGGYETNSPIRLPVLQKTVWDGITKGDAVSYLGGTAEVVGKSPEQIN